eukprot:m.409026 g.409026  ORF g.409026 m.409026 type:complete len:430 (+) comp21240_c0_seq6:199-1488(+)
MAAHSSRSTGMACGSPGSKRSGQANQIGVAPNPVAGEDVGEDDDDDVEDPESPRVRLQTVTNRGQVIKSGFLNKVGDRPLTRRTWRKRFFVLSETALAYFTKDTSTAGALLKGGVLLHRITEIRKATGAEKIRPYILVLVTSSRVYYMQARSDSERTVWITTITATATKARDAAQTGDIEDRQETGASSSAPSTTAMAADPTPDPTAALQCIIYVNDMLSPPMAFLHHLRTGCTAVQMLLSDVGVPSDITPVDAAHWTRLEAELPPQGLPTTLPLYELDSTRLAHAATVTRRICHQTHGHLLGDSPVERLLAGEVSDIVCEWRQAVPQDAMDLTKPSYATAALRMYLKLFEVRLVSRDVEFVAGSVFPLYADYEVYSMLYAHVKMDAAVLDPFPRLRDFVDLMSSRPNISAYLAQCSNHNSIAVTFGLD